MTSRRDMSRGAYSVFVANSTRHWGVIGLPLIIIAEEILDSDAIMIELTLFEQFLSAGDCYVKKLISDFFLFTIERILGGSRV